MWTAPQSGSSSPEHIADMQLTMISEWCKLDSIKVRGRVLDPSIHRQGADKRLQTDYLSLESWFSLCLSSSLGPSSLIL